MKPKNITVFLACICLLVSCAEDSVESTNEVHESHTAYESNTSDESNESEAELPPPGYVQYINCIVFDSVSAMKNSIENDLLSESDKLNVTLGGEYPDNLAIDTDKLYVLGGLPEGYSESGVEWHGGNDYNVMYTNESAVISYTPVLSEDALRTSMEYFLRDSGTYENLAGNQLVNSVTQTENPIELGYMYECTYNTRVADGYKLIYWEYSDPENGTDCILSKKYTPQGEIISSELFVYSGSLSFYCLASGADVSIEAALMLESVPLE